MRHIGVDLFKDKGSNIDQGINTDKGYRFFFMSMLGIILLSSMTTLVSPLLMNTWMEENQRLDSIHILLLLAIMVVSLFLEIIMIAIREKFSKSFNRINFLKYFDTYMKLNYDYIQKMGPANLLERIHIGVQSLYRYYTGNLIHLCINMVIVNVILGITFVQSKLIFLILLSLIPINYFGFRLINKELSKRSKILQDKSAEGWQKLLSLIDNTDYLKQLGNYSNVRRKLTLVIEDIYQAQVDINIYAKSTSSSIKGLNNIAQTLVMIILVYNIQGERQGLASIILMSIFIPLYYQSITSITNGNLDKKALIISKDFFREWSKVMEEHGEVSEPIRSISIDITQINIGDKMIVMNIHDTYHKGDVVFIEGESGSGKSSLMKLLLKFRTSEGIHINEKVIGDWNSTELRDRIDYISQNTSFMKGTLRDNIFLEHDWAEELERSLENEPLLQSVLEHKTLDDIIHDRASNLSGGEKQKIQIVRMLLNKRDAIILDEIHSNLDIESSELVYERIMMEKDQRITFIISHDDIPRKYANKFIKL